MSGWDPPLCCHSFQLPCGSWCSPFCCASPLVPPLTALFAALTSARPPQGVRTAPAAIRVVVLELQAAGTPCRGYEKPTPFSAGTSATAAFLPGASLSIATAIVGAIPLSRIRVGIAAHPQVVFSLHLVAVLVGPVILTRTTELPLPQFLIPVPMRSCQMLATQLSPVLAPWSALPCALAAAALLGALLPPASGLG